jgi:hypothetical protein
VMGQEGLFEKMLKTCLWLAPHHTLASNSQFPDECFVITHLIGSSLWLRFLLEATDC